MWYSVSSFFFFHHPVARLCGSRNPLWFESRASERGASFKWSRHDGAKWNANDQCVRVKLKQDVNLFRWRGCNAEKRKRHHPAANNKSSGSPQLFDHWFFSPSRFCLSVPTKNKNKTKTTRFPLLVSVALVFPLWWRYVHYTYYIYILYIHIIHSEVKKRI